MNFLDMLVVAQERGWRFRRKDDGAILWIDRGNLMLNGDVAECDCGLLYSRFTPIQYTVVQATKHTLPVCC